VLAFMPFYCVNGNLVDCSDKRGFFPDTDQCDKYHECSNGTVVTHLCPDGLVYDKSKFTASFQVESSVNFGKCSYPFSIDCKGRELLQTAQSTGVCPRKNGYFSNSECDQYYLCNDGAPSLYTCPQGLVFSPDKGSCTWIEEANRPGCQSEDKFTFVCPEVGPGQHPRYPDPNDCQKFYICISGSARHNSCPNGQVFHPDTLACVSNQELNLPCKNPVSKTEGASASSTNTASFSLTTKRSRVRTNQQKILSTTPSSSKTGSTERKRTRTRVRGRASQPKLKQQTIGPSSTSEMKSTDKQPATEMEMQKKWIEFES